MSRVYVDLEALGSGGPDVGRTLDGTAVTSLGHLAEAGHEVVLVAGPDAVPERLAGVVAAVVDAAPMEPPAEAWYLTTDVERCRGRSARLRTVLVGTAAAPGAIHRCDMLARDVRAAVLELLAAEAMRDR